MKDKFDKILSSKIKDLIENKEYPYNSEHWDMLIAKKKSKKRAIFYWRVSAILLLSLFVGGLGNFLMNNSTKEDLNDPQIIVDTKNDSLRINKLKNKNDFITKSVVDSLKTIDSRITNIDSINIINKLNPNYNKSLQETYTTKSSENIRSMELQIVTSKAIVDLDLFVDANISHINDLLKYKNNISQLNFEIRRNAEEENSIVSNIEEKLNKDLFSADNNLLSALEETKANTINKRRGFGIGVSISQTLNYNQINENSNKGFSGGINIDLPVSKRIDINGGVLYSNQKIDVKEKELAYIKDAINKSNRSQLKSKEAIIKGIEIPINLKYNFKLSKKDFFVSAGISSTSYFNEAVTSNYIVNKLTTTNETTEDSFGKNVVVFSLVQSEEKITSSNSTTRFNFASLLNVSFGVEMPINSNNQSVIIEPYFKYSLIPITDQKINYTSAGIHLRYNFSFRKNK